ncbi:MAG: hypothetical protein JSR60_18580 [Proteobacteria bacterium]|nr:hypothetical protein [Pseudomonadota bacterium]
MRTCIAVGPSAVALTFVFTITAAAQSGAGDADMRATSMLYGVALKCYVTLAYARDERRSAGDRSKSEFYGLKARQSFDVAYQTGEKIGLTDDRIHSDLESAQEAELPHLMRDEQYFRSMGATCKAVGLL